MRTVCDQLANFPALVIAVLNGHALCGGAEVAVAADIRVAAAGVQATSDRHDIISIIR
jgi:enoyl-CoA hydratase